jgi:hypothetical protein
LSKAKKILHDSGQSFSATNTVPKVNQSNKIHQNVSRETLKTKNFTKNSPTPKISYCFFLLSRVSLTLTSAFHAPLTTTAV